MEAKQPCKVRTIYQLRSQAISFKQFIFILAEQPNKPWVRGDLYSIFFLCIQAEVIEHPFPLEHTANFARLIFPFYNISPPNFAGILISARSFQLLQQIIVSFLIFKCLSLLNFLNFQILSHFRQSEVIFVYDFLLCRFVAALHSLTIH